MATLKERIDALATAIGVDIKALRGRSLPSGGAAGQVLAKQSAADYQVSWVDAAGTGNYLDLPNIAIPPAPPTDTIRLFARRRAGQMLPMFITADGGDTMLQEALFGATVSLWLPSGGAVASIGFGNTWIIRNTGTGAVKSHPTLATTNNMASMVRARYATGTAANGASGESATTPLYWRGNATVSGGFFAFWRFGVEALAADAQVCVGMCASTTGLAGDPSARIDFIYLAKDSTDANWQIMSRSNSGTAFKYDTGIPVTDNQILDLFIACDDNDNKISVRVLDAVTRAALVDGYTVTTNLPRNTVFLAPQALIRSPSVAASQYLALNRIYAKTAI